MILRQAQDRPFRQADDEGPAEGRKGDCPSGPLAGSERGRPADTVSDKEANP